VAGDGRTGRHDDAAHDLDVSKRPAAPDPDLPDSSGLRVGDQRFPLALALLAVGIALAAVLVIGRRRAAASGDDATPTPTEDQP
jgi:hypothetical protein